MPDSLYAPKRRLDAAALALIAAVLIGWALRGRQFLASPSLWLDELALANNLVDRNTLQLFARPLDYAQTAPPGFLLIQRLIVVAVGPTELALRAWSFFAGCAAVPLAGLLARRIAGAWFAWPAALCVALAPALIFQSAQVKPYSGDVMVTLLLLWLTARSAGREDSRPTPALMLVGVIAPWVSLAAVFTLGAVGGYWLLRALARQRTDPRAPLVAVVLVWGASALASILMTRLQMSPETSDFMQAAWRSGFAPASMFSRQSAAWLIDTMGGLARTYSGERGGRALVVLDIVGVALLLRRFPTTGLLLGGPQVLAVAGAAAHQYPLLDRVALWFGPLILLCAMCAVAQLASFLRRTRTATLAVVAPALFALGPVANALANPPGVRRVQDTKPVLQYIAANAAPGDALYVQHSAWQSAHFYRAILDASPVDVFEGRCSNTDRRRPLRDLVALTDHARIWVLFSHNERKLRETELILGFLDAIADRVEVHSIPSDFPGDANTAATVLYKLRPASARPPLDAVNWPLPLIVESAPMRGCWPTLLPPRLVDSP